MESSQTGDWTHVPYIGRWILNHWISEFKESKIEERKLLQGLLSIDERREKINIKMVAL